MVVEWKHEAERDIGRTVIGEQEIRARRGDVEKGVGGARRIILVVRAIAEARVAYLGKCETAKRDEQDAEHSDSLE